MDERGPYAMAAASAQWLRERFGIEGASAGIVLGSGWGSATQTGTPPPAQTGSTPVATPGWGEPLDRAGMADVPGFLPPIAPGHAGEILHYRWSGRDIVVLSGRTHFYEGHGVGPVVHGVRALAALGVRRLILTNANGSLRPEWPLGQVVALTDHINLAFNSPLSSDRFVDLTDVYDPVLRARALKIDPTLVTGVYAMFPGPHYETAAEAHMARLLGADLVGMSTVLEAIAAREYGIEVLALSTVTAHEASGEIIDPDEVVANAEASARRLAPLLYTMLASD